VSLRAVLFDAGNTLVHLDYPRLAKGVGAATGVPLTAERLMARAGEAAALLEGGHSTDRERATRYLEQLFLLAGVPAAQTGLVRDTLLGLHREQHLWSGVDPNTGPALDRLLGAGLRLGVVSNSDGRADEALVAVDLRRRLEEVLYVGDLYEVDVVGARRAGMDVILLDPLGKHRERDVRTAASIAEVAEMLLQSTTV
jgi:FMN phosphatase YigB (HAD superfamily)